MAAAILLLRGKMLAFIHKMRTFLMSLIVKELEVVKPRFDSTLTMPYGLAIAVAAVWTILDWPLRKWGMLPWA